jgi:hypothetical protein
LLDLGLQLVPFLPIFFGFDREMLFADGLAADAGIPDQQRVYDHSVMPGRDVEMVQVAAGDLQGIEQESGFFVVDFFSQDEADHLHDGGLDGVAVLEDREERGAGIALAARLNAVGAEMVITVADRSQSKS